MWMMSDNVRSPGIGRLLSGRGEMSTFRLGDRRADVFHPLEAWNKSIHLRLKAAFDPDRLFNPGRLFSWL